MSENEITKLKQEYNFRKLEVHPSVVYIDSQFDSWFIEINSKIKLHHKNTRHVTKHYHSQPKEFPSLYSALSYINRHEIFKLEKVKSPPD
jgi:dolichyl-phosphate-mannose--protein O-mannosyl transferase